MHTAAAVVGVGLILSGRAFGASQTPLAAGYEGLDDLPAEVAEQLPCKDDVVDSEGKMAESDEGCGTKVRFKRDVLMWGVILKAGSIASSWDDSRSGILARDILYKGVRLKGGMKIWMYQGDWGGTLSGDQRLNGVPCRGGKEVTADMKRGLRECILAESHRARGRNYSAGEHFIAPMTADTDPPTVDEGEAKPARAKKEPPSPPLRGPAHP